MKLILLLAMYISVVSCATTGSGGAGEGIQTHRQFFVKVRNVSDHVQSIGIYDYEDKNELLGISVADLYEQSLKQTLAVGESYTIETHRAGLAITYNYKIEDMAYGKRLRWRAGGNSDIFMEFEFKNLDDGALVQTSEN